jgi:hypothetical protein
MIKDFVWNGNPWRVREVDCKETPGARANHCLVFENDESARRVWDYPTEWRNLSGESLGPMMEAQHQMPSVSSAGLFSTMSANIARANALCNRLRSLREEQRSLVARRDALVGQCNDLRAELRDTVEGYGKSLREGGTSAAGALALIQTFVGEAVGSRPQSSDSTELLDESVAWGIAAYNDAA